VQHIGRTGAMRAQAKQGGSSAVRPQRTQCRWQCVCTPLTRHGAEHEGQAAGEAARVVLAAGRDKQQALEAMLPCTGRRQAGASIYWTLILGSADGSLKSKSGPST